MKKIISSIILSTLIFSGCSTTPQLNTALSINENSVIKSSQDKRDYKFKQLDNGLNVVVVSDPDADKAAASLDVHIGHLADPADREGITHYLEHMLFLGTKKYPEVGEYGNYISQNGGSKNAGTGTEHTSYFFSIDNAHLEPALDRFSRFFIDPLFSPEFVEKERNAVNSEYSLKTKDDARRYREAVKQTANQAHPMTQFSVGNLDTLSDSDTSTILDAVKSHYDKYYSAEIMSLAVIGNYSTDELMQWAESKFSEVPNKGDARDLNRPEPYLSEQKGVQIGVQTLEDKRTLRLEFAMPESLSLYESKPLRYISNLIGHQGKNSLYDNLNNKGYLKNMYAYNGGTDDFSLLTVHFDLTEKGYASRNEIVEWFFAYSNLINEQGINKTYFNENAQIANLAFEYQDKSSVQNYAGSISHSLQHYPAAHVLDVSRLYSTFDPKLIKEFFTYITPDNIRVITSAPDIRSDTKEARYDVAYTMEPIDESVLNSWKQPQAKEGLKLPEPNPYIAQDLSRKNKSAIQEPKLAYEKEGLKLWYVNENEFKLPKSSLNFRLYSPLAYKNNQYKVAIPLHNRIINDLMNAESYAASQAGLYYGVSNSSRSYDIGVQGYNDKIDTFLQKILNNFSADKIQEETFTRLKTNMIKDINNRKFARPVSQNFNVFRLESSKESLSDTEQLDALNNLDFKTFKGIVDKISQQFEIEGIYSGNISKSDVKNIGDILNTHFQGKLQNGSKLIPEFLKLPEGSQYIRPVSIDHNDSTIVWAIQGDNPSYAEKAKYSLLRKIIGQRFYKSLRTEQQYGYVVSSFNYDFDEIPSIVFLIQSPKAHPSILKNKIGEFLESELEYLQTISADEYQTYVDGLLSDINKKFDNIYAKGNTLHSEIIDENYKFDSRKQLTDAVKKLSSMDIANFFESEILADERRSMLLWSIGKAHQNTPEFNPANYDICTIDKCIYSKSIKP